MKFSTAYRNVQNTSYSFSSSVDSGNSPLSAGVETTISFGAAFLTPYELSVWGTLVNDDNTRTVVKVVSSDAYGFTVVSTRDVNCHYIAIGSS